jgi:chromosome segregation protein
MKLKQLHLQGDKTFATKTECVFDDGITAIVGPNGSGKSNIADALRWVLGEQSYSTLRGKRTTDMIFAGSESRPRAGMAQALLTLDNSGGWLPIDYAEVEIGRRAFRSGENEYILNGQQVRLRDVTELLASSGLAERTYTIIGQGLVDQALSLRAEERRALFEEAAGINYYKTKRAETLRRLQETQRNLERVHDILAEIRPRLSSLKRQATRARNYEQVATDLHYSLRLWYGHKWEQAKTGLRQARERAREAETAWQESRQRLLAQQEKIEVLQQRINRRQQQMADTEASRDRVREQLEETRRQVAILRERTQSLQQQLAHVEQELPALTRQRTTAEAELASATAELETAQATLNDSQTRLEQFNATFQTQQTEINRWQEELQQSEEQRQTTQTHLAQMEGQLSQLQERLQEQEAQNEAPDADEITAAMVLVQRYTAELESAQAAMDELSQQRNETQTAQQTADSELKALRAAVAEQEQQLQQRRNQVARQQARLDLLDQMRHKEVDTGHGAPILGRLASLITIPDQYQTAVEAALKTRLATLVVADATHLWQLVDDGDPEQPLTLAALDHLHPPPTAPTPHDTAVIGWASNLVDYDTDVQPLVQLLLGHVLLVKEAKSAYRLAQTLPPAAVAVAPDGFVAHAGGLVETYGDNAPDSVLVREAEWQQAKEELATLAAEVAQRQTAVAAERQKIQAKQEAAEALQTRERQLQQRQQEANQRLSQAQVRLDNARQRQAFLVRQQEAQAQQVERLRQRIGEVEANIERQQQTVVTLTSAVSHARTRLEALPVAEAQQQRQSLRQKIDAAQTIVAGRQAVVDSRRTTLNQVNGQLERLKERQQDLDQQLQQLALGGEEARQKQLQQQLDALDAELDPIKDDLVQSRKSLLQLGEKTAAIQKQTHERETHYTQAQIALSRQENQIEGLQERIKADLGLVALDYDEDQTGPTPLPIQEVVEQLPQVAELPDDIEETIQNYRGQMQRMGAINPDAPAEYEETEERYHFLNQQIEDLNQTEAQLRQVIRELDDLTSHAFADTVTKVNRVFGDIFEQLFGGGDARLVLTDPDDLTSSGVDIITGLPNRREQGLALLSGGERSLTAAALIFSLLKVSPTPFCVLDEVDAALDEANINRFRELLRELSLKTQFVVITHNRGTVQAAQTLYGVSMGADSTSQVISIKPEEYLNGNY